MSNTTFGTYLNLLSTPLHQLSDSDLPEYLCLVFLKSLNQQRKSNTLAPLHLDQLANAVAKESLERLAQLSQLVSSHGVVGLDFTQVCIEGNVEINPSYVQNKSIQEAFIRFTNTMDDQSMSQLME